jgi:DNA-directed RNA polymerase subunit E'/Rpb7
MDKEPFSTSLLNYKAFLSFNEVGNNIQTNLQKKIEYQVEGRCIAEGLVVPNSISIISYSAGKVNNQYIEFDVVYKCNICLPVEGMIIECIVKTITKAGIHAEYIYNNKSLVTVFITRDDNYENKTFSKITNSGTKINAMVTGVIFELNDTTISVTAELM